MKIILIGILVVASIFFINGCQVKTEKASQQSDLLLQENRNIIEITASGFIPSTRTIKVGQKVTFINKDTRQHWPASDMHPIHTAYPEKGGCIGSTFDACHGLKSNESFSFTFNHEGSWRYHDHLNSGLSGIITVER